MKCEKHKREGEGPDLKLKIVNVDLHGCILFINMQSFVRRAYRHIIEQRGRRGRRQSSCDM